MRILVLLTLVSALFGGFCFESEGAESDLLSALAALKGHVDGSAPLSGTGIQTYKQIIDSNNTLFGSSSATLTAGFELVETYDSLVGPLFVSGSPVQSFSRSNTSDTDINWAVYNVMQYIIDYSYTNSTILSYPAIIDGFKFGTSEYFPGAVNPPADPNAEYTITVDGSYPNTFGHDKMHQERPARKPTGAYLAPGSIATVTVPSNIVGKGYLVRVGGSSWDFSNKPTIKRVDRSTIVYEINSTEVKVANPLGGGIYLEVPQYSYEGLVELKIKNAVRSPYFSMKSFHKTSLQEWQDVERHHPGPWADFQSDKFMIHVPTDWIYNFDDPNTLMEKWDAAMNSLDQLMGFPEGSGKETMFLGVDLFIRSGAYSPGYPTINVKYNPNSDYGGNSNHYLIKGPEYVPNYVFHEEGHGYLFVKFAGERESAVNLPHVGVWHRQFGFDLDEAFAGSRQMQGNPYRTLDNTAVAWMTSFNFSPREVPMHEAEKAYQLKGHAKYVDIARLFGWEGLDQFWYSINEDYENGIIWSKHGSPTDDLIVRWCESVGTDLRPLLHFWGIHPSDAASLQSRIEDGGFQPSAKIYSLLMKYKSLVPLDNSAFQTWAYNWWGREPNINGAWTETEHARQWDTQIRREKDANSQQRPNGEIYTEGSAAEIRDVIDRLIALYFPDGPPHFSCELGGDMVSWSGQTIQVNADIVNNTASTLNYTWSIEPGTGVLISSNENQAAVTITKPIGSPVSYKLSLTLDDGSVNPSVTDVMTISVYDDACQATRLGLGQADKKDIYPDCIIDINDLALLLSAWLNDNSLSAPVYKPVE